MLEQKRQEEEAEKQRLAGLAKRGGVWELRGGPQGADWSPFTVGMRVEARYKQGEEWYPGTVTKLVSGGLMSIAYDDGERETRVHASCVRPIGGFPAPEGQEDDSDDSESTSDDDDDGGGGGGGFWQRAQRPAKDAWAVAGPKPKKTSTQRAETRAERATTDKNRKKRAAKREKELAMRELHRASL
ncbi:hypothetical protein JKP88DRAFT_264463 [Tribonema minus]|uniref:Tudor domain-containing protein n=1 Tax=Tribonema minus TaxID=303371 RepID=A0A835YPI3_9STRA|nr:hypothetical protein JKP88DRAFT_264463 [Tribonema minus]